MVRIPIYFISRTSQFDVRICLNDAYDDRIRTQETAILSVSNTALGIDIVKSNLPLNSKLPYCFDFRKKHLWSPRFRRLCDCYAYRRILPAYSEGSKSSYGLRSSACAFFSAILVADTSTQWTFLQITPANTSFCVKMQAIESRSLVTVGEEGVKVMKVKATNTVVFDVSRFGRAPT